MVFTIFVPKEDTSFDHSTTCGYVCIHQQVGQPNTMKDHTQTLISVTKIKGHMSNVITTSF